MNALVLIIFIYKSDSDRYKNKDLFLSVSTKGDFGNVLNGQKSKEKNLR